jgi:uncharacterized phage protein (TIGR01671 family)
MREIKFRGKDIEDGIWRYGGYYKHQNRTPCVMGDCIKDTDFDCLIFQSGFSDWNMTKPLQYAKVIEKTVGQFTGLLDKHGKEIYEDDFIKYGNRVFLIKYIKAITSYVAYGKDKDGDFTNLWLAPTVSLGNVSFCEVIGNIHDKESGV